MEYRKEAQHFVIRLEKGEKAMEKLNEFLAEKQIMGGFLQGIGAIERAEIGWYDVKNKKYEWKVFNGEMEVISFSGTISETGLHAHMALGDKEGKAFGGHLKEATVSATLEIFLTEMKKIRRKEDANIGLKLIEL